MGGCDWWITGFTGEYHIQYRIPGDFRKFPYRKPHGYLPSIKESTGIYFVVKDRPPSTSLKAKNPGGFLVGIIRPFKLSTLKMQWAIFWPEWIGMTVLEDQEIQTGGVPSVYAFLSSSKWFNTADYSRQPRLSTPREQLSKFCKVP